jgi:hypothetical protein
MISRRSFLGVSSAAAGAAAVAHPFLSAATSAAKPESESPPRFLARLKVAQERSQLHHPCQAH